MATLDTIKELLEEKIDIDFGEPDGLDTIEDPVSYVDSL